MKILVMLLFFIFLLTSSFSDELQDRIEQLSELGSKTNIVLIRYDPFKRGSEVVSKTFEQKSQETSLYVTTIMNNRAFVGSKWYRVGDIVNGYKLLQINDTSVLAKHDRKIVKFGLKKSDKLLKIRNKK